MSNEGSFWISSREMRVMGKKASGQHFSLWFERLRPSTGEWTFCESFTEDDLPVVAHLATSARDSIEARLDGDRSRQVG